MAIVFWETLVTVVLSSSSSILSVLLVKALWICSKDLPLVSGIAKHTNVPQIAEKTANKKNVGPLPIKSTKFEKNFVTMNAINHDPDPAKLEAMALASVEKSSPTWNLIKKHLFQ